MASLSLAFDILAKDRASKVFKDVGNAAEDTGKKGSKLGGILGAAKGGVAAGAAIGTAALVGFGGAAVQAASEGEQSMGAIESVFGKAAEAVKRFSEDSAERLGLSQNDYRELASVVGSQLKNMGQSQDEAAVSSDKLIALGGDLAATFGGSVSDAVGAVGSLLRGERDPIERYGIAIKDADVKARLAADGNSKLTGAAKKTAEAQATLKLLTEQAAGSLGAFGRESDTLAGKQERLKAKFGDVKEQIGTKLLPAVTSLAGKLLDLIDGFEKGTGSGGKLKDAMDKVKKTFEENRPQIEAVLKAVGKLAEFWLLTYLPAVVRVVTYTVGALVDAFNAVKSVMLTVASGALGMVGTILGALGSLFGALAKIPGPFQDNFKKASGAINGAKSTVDALKVAVDLAAKPKTVKVTADVAGARGDIDSVKTRIDRLKNKTVTLTINQIVRESRIAAGKGDIPGFASGGILPRGLAVVGERGPELIASRGGDRVFSNGDSQRIVSGGDTALVTEVAALRASNERIERILAAMPRDYQLGQRQGPV